MQREDEKHGRHQIADLLNGLSISVSLRSPGDLEHFQHPVGDQETANDIRHRGKQCNRPQQSDPDGLFPSPTTIIEPTTAIAEMALVSDISGVCSNRETRPITPSPINAASMKTNSSDQ